MKADRRGKDIQGTERGRTYREQKRNDGWFAKHQDQGTTEQHPGDLEKNAVFKETKAISRSPCSPLEWGGKGRRREELGRAHWQDCCGQEKNSKELLKHSLLCRGWCRLPDGKLSVRGKDWAPGGRSCYHTSRPTLQADSQATISLKTIYFPVEFQHGMAFKRLPSFNSQDLNSSGLWGLEK